ncbi:3690_t:CDS:2 [Funneliformis mosseae]|uniref:Chromatin modification-related protein EAF3 n=1 Tax=Funneliformis mosseae TaxID=27381 RepID=A0A9N8YUR8_FUNMO|nr:3690_t:CDS:2 [Funneliformis mosseae]
MSKENDFLHQEGEKVFCFHGKFIYEAKIVDTKYYVEPNRNPKTGLTGPHYHIHYAGWKSSWDEWVDESRVLKYDETNIEKHKQIIKSLEKKSPAIKRTVNDPCSENGRKRRKEQPNEREVIVKKSKPKEIFSVPEPLKAILYRDWKNIHIDGTLVPLPRKPTVKDIIEDYRSNRTDYNRIEENSDDGIGQEIISGLHFYFNKCLGVRLLYKGERKQYRVTRLKFEYLDNSQIFGAEHLLRLFDSSLSQETLNALKLHLSDFLK